MSLKRLLLKTRGIAFAELRRPAAIFNHPDLPPAVTAVARAFVPVTRRTVAHREFLERRH
jgi:hypothetical protein